MFNIPMHASKNAVERNRSLFFSLFRPKPGVTIVSRRIQLLFHADADSTGAHFQSRSLSTVPSQERASVCLKWGYTIITYSDYVNCENLLLFFYGSVVLSLLCFYIFSPYIFPHIFPDNFHPYVFMSFPFFSPLPKWNESMAIFRLRQSRLVCHFVSSSSLTWTDIRTLHGGGGCKEGGDMKILGAWASTRLQGVGK